MKAKTLSLIKRIHLLQAAIYDLSGKMEETDRYNDLTDWPDSAGISLQDAKYYMERLLDKLNGNQ